MSGHTVFIPEADGRFRKEFHPINQSGDPTHADIREVEKMSEMIVKQQLKMRGIERYYMLFETDNCYYTLPRKSTCG